MAEGVGTAREAKLRRLPANFGLQARQALAKMQRS